MIDILAILPPSLPTIQVLDVGAMAAGADMYEPLRAAGLARVVGFEPQRAECRRLNEVHGAQGHRYLPYFIGDGSSRMFYVTRDGFSSSLYEPNLELVSKFQELGQAYQVTGTGQVQTRRLDDLPEIGPIDLVKLDVQGAELDVIRGGAKTIGGALLVHAEVEFVEMYKGQPLFADVDVALRAMGFSFHKFQSVFGRALIPLVRDHPSQRISQMLWADAVYTRSIMSLDRLAAEQLIKLAVIAHMLYAAVDLAHLALAHHDRVTGAALAAKYLQALTQGATAT